MQKPITALTALAAILASATIGCGGSSSSSQAATEVQSPKHVILIIGDGMQMEHEVAASRYLTGTDDGLAFHAFPFQSYVSTWDVTAYNKYASFNGTASYAPGAVDASTGYDITLGGVAPYPVDTADHSSYFYLNSTLGWPATDSASAATAMSTGYKTDDGNIAWLSGDPSTGGNRTANNGSLKTIAEIAREERGMAIGVVSTVPFNHATPAGFVSHNVNRNNYYIGYKSATTGIADEIISTIKPEVVIGGGHPLLDNPAYSTTKGYISQSLHNTLKASSDFVFAERATGMNGSITLAQAADTAVAGGKKLFGLYGGAGGNFEYHVPTDTPGSPSVARGSYENPELKDASVAALKVLSQNEKGFFLMIEQGDIDWANHANQYENMIGCMYDLNETVKSVVSYVDQPGDDIDWTNTLLIVTSDHSNSFMRLSTTNTLGIGDLPPTDATERANYVTYGTTGHTNELVTIYAKGPTAALTTLSSNYRTWYNADILDNTHLFHSMATFIGAPKTSPLTVTQ
ncbi:alkaline phosphatase [Holophaga foetida]|uniref:alkaline phosphatase n=1 Tax=Holophaga foetida TaxID=35839 RepID=UPI0002473EC4|nr:alkaline phosphatase [Holophaga foetida]